MEIIKELSQEERFTWGKCPVCQAEHGKKCHPEVGICLGRNVNGDLPDSGAHLARLNNAPFKVKLVPCWHI